MSRRSRPTNTGKFAKKYTNTDKQVKCIDSTVTDSQGNVTLYTATFPCFLTGIRWDLSFVSQTAASDVRIGWGLIVSGDGYTPNTLVISSSAADFYTPESDIIIPGHMCLRDSDVGSGPSICYYNGSCKTGRKLKAGDVFYFSHLATVANGGGAYGVVQFVVKT